MDQGSDDIRQDIDATRSSLDEKLSQLEGKASDASDTVREASQKVIDAIDIRSQVDARPWTALGVAVAAGYVLGSLGGNDEPSYNRSNYQSSTGTPSYTPPSSTSSGPSTTDMIKEKSADFLSQFDDEIDMLKGAAISAVTAFIRDSVKEYAPSMSRHIDDAMRQRGLPVNDNTAPGSSGQRAPVAPHKETPSGKQVSSSATESFAAMGDMPNADYDNIGQMNRVGMPPKNNPSDSEYYETYQPNTSSDAPEPPATQPASADRQAREDTTNYAQ